MLVLVFVLAYFRMLLVMNDDENFHFLETLIKERHDVVSYATIVLVDSTSEFDHHPHFLNITNYQFRF